MSEKNRAREKARVKERESVCVRERERERESQTERERERERTYQPGGNGGARELGAKAEELGPLAFEEVWGLGLRVSSRGLRV